MDSSTSSDRQREGQTDRDKDGQKQRDRQIGISCKKTAAVDWLR